MRALLLVSTKKTVGILVILSISVLKHPNESYMGVKDLFGFTV